MPTISLALGERSYDIHVENGALDRTGEFAYRAGLDGKIAVITDSCVAPLYAERVMKSLESAGFMPSLHVVNAGEASKNMLQAQELCSELVRAGLDRTGCIAALGGGILEHFRLRLLDIHDLASCAVERKKTCCLHRLRTVYLFHVPCDDGIYVASSFFP